MKHEFVQHIPDKLESDVLYVSIDFDLAVHSCFCGCGQDVVTPFSPAEWSLTYDGRSISLSPSIGNWNFPCKSHYWIRRGKVEWATRFTDEKIQAVREKDRLAKVDHYGAKPLAKKGQRKSIWRKLTNR
jgi:Family of unknown function (DUF6527)